MTSMSLFEVAVVTGLWVAGLVSAALLVAGVLAGLMDYLHAR